MRAIYWAPDGDGARPATADEASSLFTDNQARRVAEDTTGDLWVSTVFLVIDHYHGDDPNHPPILWETMVFGQAESPWVGRQWRFASRHIALAWHHSVCDAIRSGLTPEAMKGD